MESCVCEAVCDLIKRVCPQTPYLPPMALYLATGKKETQRRVDDVIHKITRSCPVPGEFIEVPPLWPVLFQLVKDRIPVLIAYQYNDVRHCTVWDSVSPQYKEFIEWNVMEAWILQPNDV